MPLPHTMPTGARIMVRTFDGVNEVTHRQEYRDYIGHVISWDGQTLHLMRDAAANGSRPEMPVDISADNILVLKPIPERRVRPLQR